MRTLVQTIAIWAVVLALPGAAQAAVCADYSKQADAQKAADTRDADGDGIYCEALPCPCLKPGQTGSTRKPKPTARRNAPLTGRAQITRVVGTTILEVRIARVGRSRGLRSQERVRLIGVDAPNVGECGGAEARARLLQLAFGNAARDTDGDGLVDEEPLYPLRSGAIVDLRTDVKLSKRDGSGRLLAYLSGGHTGIELAERQTRTGWATLRYSSRVPRRFQRLASAEASARSRGAGAWVLCHGDFHRPASQQFVGFAACRDSVDTNGTRVHGGHGFMRLIIVRNIDCAAGYGLVQAWATATFEPSGGGVKDAGPPTQVGAFACANQDLGAENPAIEAVCAAADGQSVAFIAAS